LPGAIQAEPSGHAPPELLVLELLDPDDELDVVLVLVPPSAAHWALHAWTVPSPS
jgi:hypothetical protein